MATTRITNGTRQRGTLPMVLDYLTANADMPITADTLVRETGHNRSSVIGSANRIIAKYPNARSGGHGIYVWDSTPPAATSTTPATPAADELLVTVVRRKADGSILVRDAETTELYVLTPFEF
jgi:hypothetical protein